MKYINSRMGFTIVELLIVIVVIGILAAIVIIAFSGAQDRARETVVKSDLAQARNQLLVDQITEGSFPDSTEEANGNEGLGASDGTVYEYTVDNSVSPQTFCLSAVNEDKAYHITEGGTVTEGVCAGHSGPVVGGSPIACDSGFIPVPGNSAYGTSDFCVAKYEMKNVGGTATSQAGGTPWVLINQTDASTEAAGACSGCHLITEAEWLTIATDVLGVASNWHSGMGVGNGSLYRGHSDNDPANALEAGPDYDNCYGVVERFGDQCRTLTLSNGEIIWDFSGNVWEWTSGQTTGGQPGAAGYAWREWNAIEGTGSLSPSPFPSYGTSAASGWTANTHGIGRVYSSTSETGTRGFFRGGHWGHGSTYTGIFALDMSTSPAYTSTAIGFRVAR